MLKQAVVLARGAGAPEGVGPLHRVAGLTLVKRALLALSRAGIERAIVIGPPDVRAALEADADYGSAGLALEVIDAPAGGSDVEALGVLRGRLAEPVVLVRADRVFDVDVARKAAQATLAGTDVEVCLDRREGRGVAVALGAGAPGADVGVWAVAPGFFERLEPQASLLDNARRAGARAIDIGEALWMPADTIAAAARAEQALFRALKKRVDGPVSRWLNRTISIFVTRQLVDTAVTPNQMTVVSTIVGAAGVVLVFQATWLTVALGAFLVQMQSVLDGCDGELARLKFQSSRIGEWLDNVLDDHVNVAYGVALGFAATELTGTALWFWLGLVSAIAFTIHNAIFYAQLAWVHRSGNPFNFRWWFQTGAADVTELVSRPTLVSRLGAVVRALVRRDVFLFSFFLLAAVRLPAIAVTWYACVAASQFGLMMLHVLYGGPWKFRVRRPAA